LEGRLQGETLQAEPLLGEPLETKSLGEVPREAEPVQEEGPQHIQ
jgi:hypothetical protein